jgi:hypothetical protein
MKLFEIQRQFYKLATAAENVTNQGVDVRKIAEWVIGDERFSAVDRLDVYANMYFYRILDVLREQFGRVLATIGETYFHNLVTEYLQACPPTHFSLGHVGAPLADYLKTHALCDQYPQLADMAALEWQYVQLFDGPDATFLTFADLQQIAPDDFGDLQLKFIPCHTLLKISHDIDGDHQPLLQTLLVWRKALSVQHRPLTAHEEQAMQYRTFGDLCEWLCNETSEQKAAPIAFELLKQWIQDQLLAK